MTIIILGLWDDYSYILGYPIYDHYYDYNGKSHHFPIVKDNKIGFFGIMLRFI